MKKQVIAMLAACLPLLICAQVHEVYIEDFEIEPGTVVEVPIMLHSETPSRGIQLYLTICDGLTIEDISLTKESVDKDMNLISRRHVKEDYTFYVLGTYPNSRVCYDTVPTPVINLSFAAAEDFAGGTLKVWHVRGSTIDNVNITMGDSTTVVTVPDQRSGIPFVVADEQSSAITQTAYFTPAGAAVSHPTGVTIEVQRRADGTVNTRKRYMR